MDSNAIAKKLVELRGDRTQKEIADALCIAVSTYAMYEIGQRIPSDENKIKIAKLYKVSVQSLFYAN